MSPPLCGGNSHLGLGFFLFSVGATSLDDLHTSGTMVCLYSGCKPVMTITLAERWPRAGSLLMLSVWFPSGFVREPAANDKKKCLSQQTNRLDTWLDNWVDTPSGFPRRRTGRHWRWRHKKKDGPPKRYTPVLEQLKTTLSIW